MTDPRGPIPDTHPCPLTIDQAAAVAGVTAQTIRNWIAAGGLPREGSAGFTEEAVRRYVAEQAHTLHVVAEDGNAQAKGGKRRNAGRPMGAKDREPRTRRRSTGAALPGEPLPLLEQMEQTSSSSPSSTSTGTAEGGAEDATLLQYKREQARLENEKRAHQLAVMRKEVLPVADVKEAMTQHLQRLRQAVCGVPRSAAGRIISALKLGPEQIAVVETVLDQVIEQRVLRVMAGDAEAEQGDRGSGLGDRVA